MKNLKDIRITKTLKICFVILTILNTIFNICFLILFRPRVISYDNLGFDYIGVVIGILSFLVTILIGWQIWNVINIDNKIRLIIYDKSKQIKRQIHKEINIKSDYMSAVLLHQKANEMKDPAFSLYVYYDSLYLYIKSKTLRENIFTDINLTLFQNLPKLDKTTKSEIIIKYKSLIDTISANDKIKFKNDIDKINSFLR